MSKKYTALVFQVIPLIITFNLWLLSKESVISITQTPLRSLAQILGLMGFVLMAINLVMATRARWVESVFGGLDKVYLSHHILGSVAFVLLLNHPLFMVVNSLPSLFLAKSYLLPGSDWSYNFGILALYLMFFAFIFIVIVRIPYQKWLQTHRLLALTFGLACIHLLLISSDVSNSLILRWWMLIVAGGGSGAALYTLFMYKGYGPKYDYIVEKIERRLDIVNVYLRPAGPKISYWPGQFAYVVFENKEAGGESHPFSFSNYSRETIRFSVKALGDYTLKVPTIRAGDRAEIFGPYGRFGHSLLSEKREMIWIAGGIGVTPFLSMLDFQNQHPSGQKIDFFYGFGAAEEGVFVEEIEKLAQGTQIAVHPWCSAQKGRLAVEQIKALGGDNLAAKTILICGPQAMMENFRAQFLKEGVPEKQITFENFNLI